MKKKKKVQSSASLSEWGSGISSILAMWLARSSSLGSGFSMALRPPRSAPDASWKHLKERGYPKEVGPQEADDLRAGLLDLSSTVIGDINLCGTATPPTSPGQIDRPGSCRERLLPEMGGRRLRSRPARHRWPRPLRLGGKAERVISPSSRPVG